MDGTERGPPEAVAVTGEETEWAIRAVEFDADEPYADVDVSALPAWWRENLREFSEHGLRTYLPARFADGPVVYREVERLERTHAVDVRFVGIGVSHGDDWELHVNREPVATVGKRRTSAGYTVFEVTSDEFERLVRTHVTGHQ